MKKIILIILDGLGDRPIDHFNNYTPLEKAATPNLDLLSKRSICGEMYSISHGVRPSSDVAHISIFGADYKLYYTGRGPIELCGLGVNVGDKDLALRGNFAIINDSNLITDRRAKRATLSDEIIKRIQLVTIENVDFILHPVAEHRFALQIKGNDLSDDITDSDPHVENVKPILVRAKNEHNTKAVFTANIINNYIEKINVTLNQLYLKGISQSNCILLRSCGFKPHFYNLCNYYNLKNACCITNNALYNGVGSLFGMDILLPKRFSKVEDYYRCVPSLVDQALENYDFTFLHFQEPDLYGEDGNYVGKKEAIERIDNSLNFLNNKNIVDNVIVCVTADHSTPCSLKAHSGDSVPIIIGGKEVRSDTVTSFGERSCATGGLGTIYGKDVIPLLLNLVGNTPLIGG
jgi:2,3-bisphosphoglycerate-independent phosphoglycerate mutase